MSGLRKLARELIGILGGVLASFRHEWRQLAYAPSSFIFQAGFLTALAALIFGVADLYASDETSPHLLVTFLPWVASIFVPALAMRAFGDGAEDRSMELIASLPLRPAAVTGGKFLAGFAFLLLTPSLPSASVGA